MRTCGRDDNCTLSTNAKSHQRGRWHGRIVFRQLEFSILVITLYRFKYDALDQTRKELERHEHTNRFPIVDPTEIPESVGPCHCDTLGTHFPIVGIGRQQSAKPRYTTFDKLLGTCEIPKVLTYWILYKTEYLHHPCITGWIS